MTAASRQDPLVSDVAKLAVGIAGLALCLTLVFLGMRAVMDVGGACADGGPYVSAQRCPQGSTVALLGGMFGLFLFGGIAMWYGARIGGIWSAVPLLAWSGLFLSLGGNFLDYGVLNTPEGEGIIWGWAICGVMFMVMGGAPLIGGLSVFGAAPLRRSLGGTAAAGPGPGATGVRTVVLGPTVGGDGIGAFRAASATAAAASAPAPAPEPARRAELAAISADMGAAVTQALHESAAPDVDATPADNAFDEGTQALLDRLERLADLRDRGLLAADEYETAKETIVRELEARQ
ncbi:MAG TPA: SHOCT domain-containing protein [Candidatus Limnocylindrales bacterium]